MSDNNTALRSSGVRRGDSSPIHFNNILDCPDVTVKPGEWLTMRFSYFWGNEERTVNDRFVMPLLMHLKDYLKIRQKNRRDAFIDAQNKGIVQGELPEVFNIRAQITYGDPRRNPYMREAPGGTGPGGSRYMR